MLSARRVTAQGRRAVPEQREPPPGWSGSTHITHYSAACKTAPAQTGEASKAPLPRPAPPPLPVAAPVPSAPEILAETGPHPCCSGPSLRYSPRRGRPAQAYCACRSQAQGIPFIITYMFSNDADPVLQCLHPDCKRPWCGNLGQGAALCISSSARSVSVPVVPFSYQLDLHRSCRQRR